MFEEMFKEDNLEFDFDKSKCYIKLTQMGEGIIKLLDPNGKFPKNEEGYYEIFTTQLFSLYRSLLMRKSDCKITDLVDGPILIPSVYLKNKEGISVKHK